MLFCNLIKNRMDIFDYISCTITYYLKKGEIKIIVIDYHTKGALGITVHSSRLWQKQTAKNKLVISWAKRSFPLKSQSYLKTGGSCSVLQSVKGCLQGIPQWWNWRNGETQTSKLSRPGSRQFLICSSEARTKLSSKVWNCLGQKNLD